MSATPSSYSITMRLHTAPDHGVVGAVATAIATAGGIVTGDRRRRLEPRPAGRRRHLLGLRRRPLRASSSTRSREVEGVEVHKVSDRTFLLHIGGKIEVSSKVPLRTRDDLSMAYTPGVGPGQHGAGRATPRTSRRLTIKGNSVAVVTDGSAVLGLGNIGPGAALPVMEGKAALFKRFADIDAWPICLASQDTDEIVKAVEMIAPGLRRHQPRGHRRPALLRDRAPAAGQPRHPGLPRRPARHRDRGAGRADQRAARAWRRSSPTSGSSCPAPARPASAIVTLLLAGGAADVVVCDKRGRPLAGDDEPAARRKAELAARTNPRQAPRRPARRPAGRRRVHRRQRARGSCRPSGSRTWRRGAWSSRWPTPTPRSTRPRPRSTPPWWPAAAPTTPTRSTTCWRSPASSADCSTRAPRRSPSTCCCEAADAIAHVVKDDELNPNFIIPSVFNPDVPKAVAAAIRGADCMSRA